MKKDSVYNVMALIYKVLKKQNLISETFLQRSIHSDPSTKAKLDQLSEEEQMIWYMVMIMYKVIFDKAGNYYRYKEHDPEKFKFLNDKRPFYQSMNRVDLTRSYIFEQAVEELKQLDFQGLEQKTGIRLDPKQLGNIVRNDIVRRTQEF
ncbi:hypothetical protein GF339_12845 [candidate division KSB3 bacterium]|uniref:Uncharacterized protein n=1 Tax=candidate division KSB3 bacterium TaxID=2044937 RepID=A0A9D5Q729_9BACT|nr:hypothetical protein [candidate division KSB3 bacterium]MBD3325471.1 hypothetical protein [candidate division KSB3 bacterium]